MSEPRQAILPFASDAVDLPHNSHRGLRNLMEFPFFSIQKSPVFETRSYDDGKVKIEIMPGHAGLATIWDKDILIFAASIVNERRKKGIAVDSTVKFHASEFFRSCGRTAGGRNYIELVRALDRLQSTSIRTNIELGDGTVKRGFHSWIKRGDMHDRVVNGKPVLGQVEIELDDWVFKQIVDDSMILSIDSRYFSLSSGVARRVYEVGRKHCGRQNGFGIALTRLAEKIGYTNDDKKGHANLKAMLCEIVAANELPEYAVHLAAQTDPDCKPIPPEKVRSMRQGLRGCKLVFIPRVASDTRSPRPSRPPVRVITQPMQPLIVNREKPPEEETIQMATVEMLRGLIETLPK